MLEALDPPRAHGPSLASGVLRAEPEDFVVEEELGFAPSGSGQHVLIKVRKRDANTQWVARELARACGSHPRDVGYAGLKDRRAVAIQWFSVPQSSIAPDAWMHVNGQGYEVLAAHAHSRKLPRGALAGNRFVVRIRGMDVDDAAFAERIAVIVSRGVPNYFGPQRFGRNGSNLARIADDLRTLRAPERGFILSAARSVVFNAVTAERVREGTWDRLEPGDIANLDARGSIFPVGPVDQELIDRGVRLDIHPTAPLWGRGVPQSAERVHALEVDVAGRYVKACELTALAGMDQERRATRLAVRDLEWHREPAAIVVSFRLARGCFATTVLREIVDAEPPEEGD